MSRFKSVVNGVNCMYYSALQALKAATRYDILKIMRCKSMLNIRHFATHFCRGFATRVCRVLYVLYC